MFERLRAKAVPLDEVNLLITSELTRVIGACKPLAVYLFGSGARGTMTEASDLDLLIVLDDHDDMKVAKAGYYRSRKGVVWPVDAIFMTGSEFVRKSKAGGVAMMCMQEGRLIYGGDISHD